MNIEFNNDVKIINIFAVGIFGLLTYSIIGISCYFSANNNIITWTQSSEIININLICVILAIIITSIIECFKINNNEKERKLR